MAKRRGAGAAAWLGRVLSALVVAVLVADAATGLFAPAKLAPAMAETGFSAARLPALSGIILLTALLYALPQTAVLGAILVAAFAGGAICAHFRLGQVAAPEQLFCASLAVAAWAGLWLRDTRVRALLPLRR